MDCYFDMGNRCKALNRRVCKDCAFKKTEKEYYEGIRKAEEILKAKKLCKCYKDHGTIVSVEEVY